jgi:hypothetical protein
MQQEQESTRHPLFSLGDVVITPGALAAFVAAHTSITPYLAQHQQGTWGNLDPHDIQANEHALQTGARLLSAYHLPDGTPIWVITEADRRSTCVLLPDEY